METAAFSTALDPLFSAPSLPTGVNALAKERREKAPPLPPEDISTPTLLSVVFAIELKAQKKKDDY